MNYKKNQITKIIANVLLYMCMVSLVRTTNVPQVLGLGYHILYGVPFAEQLNDEGLKASPFTYSYLSNQMTSDGLFGIPDFASKIQYTTCSARSGVVTGLQGYQAVLYNAASINITNPLYPNAFSMSSTWQGLKSSSLTAGQTLVYAQISCQNYNFMINFSYLSSALSAQFKADVSAALTASTGGDWSAFITKYGTHYINSVKMGGHVTHIGKLTTPAVQQLKGLNIDLQTIIQSQISKYYNFSSPFNWQRHKKDLQYVNLLDSGFISGLTKIQQSTPPTPSGGLSQWSLATKSNPWPISYQLNSLADLFTYVSGIDYAAAKASFQSAISNLCNLLPCPAPSVDPVQPPAAYMQVSRTAEYGSLDGIEFSQMVNSPFSSLNKISIRHGRQIDGLQLYFSDGLGISSEYLPAIGGGGGVAAVWQIPLGQYITSVLIRSGTRINSLKFTTNLGTTSPVFGGIGGEAYTINIDASQRIIGYYGSYGSRVHKLGFLIGQVITPAASFQQSINSTKIQLIGLNVNHNQEYITKLQLVIGDGVLPSFSTSQVGMFAATVVNWAVPENQTVNRIQYRCGVYINSLAFITNNGTRSATYGSNSGSYKMMKIPDDKRIVGFYGSYSSLALNRLGFIFSAPIYPNATDRSIEISVITREELIC